MKKIYVFGDIHGKLLKLENLLSKFTISPEDTLIFLGDYVDRGPDSCGVIKLLLPLKKKHPCVFIKGNHDYFFSRMYCTNGKDLNKHILGFWFEGAKATLKSYCSADINPEEHLESFYSYPKPYHVQDNKLFVHGDIERELSVHAQPVDEILWWYRELIDEAVQKHRKLR